MIARLAQILATCLIAAAVIVTPASAQAHYLLAVSSSRDARGVAPSAKADCRRGEVCAYDRRSYEGTIRKWVTCPATQWSSAFSLVNNHATATVRAYAGNTLVVTLPPGASVPSLSGITRITC